MYDGIQAYGGKAFFVKKKKKTYKYIYVHIFNYFIFSVYNMYFYVYLRLFETHLKHHILLELCLSLYVSFNFINLSFS